MVPNPSVIIPWSGNKPPSTRNSAAIYKYYGRPTNYRSLRQFYRASSRPGRSGSADVRGEDAYLGEVRAVPEPPPVTAIPDYMSSRSSESYLRNPLQDSVRGCSLGFAAAAISDG